jgi:hypothetical protein
VEVHLKFRETNLFLNARQVTGDEMSDEEEEIAAELEDELLEDDEE